MFSSNQLSIFDRVMQHRLFQLLDIVLAILLKTCKANLHNRLQLLRQIENHKNQN